MSEAPLLYKLQIIDLDIEQTTQALQEIEPQLGESEELVAARAKIDALKTRIHDVQSSLKDAEFDIERFQNKIKPFHDKLYGGTVKNPKELTSIEKDIELLRQSKRKVEDKALDYMTELEDLQEELKTDQSDFKGVQAAWKEQQDQLLAEQKRLSDHLSRNEQARRSLAAQISQPSLQIYESLRRMRRGRAVATVEQNTCQGCRVALPIQEVSRARNNPALSFCSHCGRILLVTR